MSSASPSKGYKLDSPTVRLYSDGTVIIEAPELAGNILIRAKDPQALLQIASARKMCPCGYPAASAVDLAAHILGSEALRAKAVEAGILPG